MNNDKFGLPHAESGPPSGGPADAHRAFQAPAAPPPNPRASRLPQRTRPSELRAGLVVMAAPVAVLIGLGMLASGSAGDDPGSTDDAPAAVQDGAGWQDPGAPSTDAMVTIEDPHGATLVVRSSAGSASTDASFAGGDAGTGQMVATTGQIGSTTVAFTCPARGCTGQVVVTVPASATVTIAEGTGPVDVSGVQNLTVWRTKGDVSASNVSGDVRVTTTTGKVNVVAQTGLTSLSVRTQSGDIRADLPDETAVDLAVTTRGKYINPAGAQVRPDGIHVELTSGTGAVTLG